MDRRHPPNVPSEAPPMLPSCRATPFRYAEARQRTWSFRANGCGGLAVTVFKSIVEHLERTSPLSNPQLKSRANVILVISK